jgi:selenocysteine lyase/cysteine desulfurase
MRAVPDPLDAVRGLFEPAPGVIYLDAATYGLPPRPTVEMMQRAVAGWQAGTADWVHDWDQLGDVARTHFAELVGTSRKNVALMPSVSVGVGTVAAALSAGDEVLASDDEFTSVLFPILVARQWGVRIRTVPFEQLAESIDPRTRLVAFSLVQSHSGRVAPLGQILERAGDVGAKTLVDATHAIPFVPVREHIDRIDYLACAAYKHLLCPRGVAFLVVGPDEWPRVPPVFANWRSTPNPYGDYYGAELKIADDAARFDVSLAWFAWAGASVSLGLLVDWQREGLLDEVARLAARLSGALEIPHTGSSLVSVMVEDAEGVRAHLAERGIRAAVRAGHVRLAPHVYNTPADVDAAANALAPFLRQAVAP